MAPDLASARELDEQGVRAFSDGRFRDALFLFREARRLGGPASEVWNIARCLQRLDEPEDAARAIQAYLVEPEITADERAEAEGELRALRSRRSTLTVLASPPGASVAVDGRAIGQTPISVQLAAGPHTIVARREGPREQAVRVEARYGRAIVVELDPAPPSAK